MNWISSKFRSVQALVIVLIITLSGCVNEVKVDQTASDLIYQPYGNTFITNSFALSDYQTMVVFEESTLALLEDNSASIKWQNPDFNLIRYASPIGERGFIVVDEHWDLGIRSIGYSIVDNNGKIVFTTPKFSKLLPDQPNLAEVFVGGVSDGDKGAYLIVLLINEYTAPVQRLLLHVNENNEIDKKIILPGFYAYITATESGSLFMIKTVSPEGAAVMQLEAIKVNMSDLNSNRLTAEWSYGFSSLEPDWKWSDYFPFKFNFSHNRLHIIKQHNTGADDLSTGIDVIILDPSNGNETNQFNIDFQTEIDNYRNQSTFKALYSNNHLDLAYNFGSKAKYTRVKLDGSVLKDIALSGKNASAEFHGIGFSGDKLFIHGLSTLNKSAYAASFRYRFDR